MDTPLPPNRQRPITSLQSMHASRQAPLQLQFLHQFPHQDILLRIDLAAALRMLEVSHEGFQRAAGFILRWWTSI